MRNELLICYFLIIFCGFKNWPVINTGLIEKNEKSSIAKNSIQKPFVEKKKKEIARLASSWNKLLANKTWQMELLGILEH